MTAAGYIRRSVVTADNPGHVSEEQQREAIRALASIDGEEVTFYVDMGRSGKDAQGRPEYMRMRSDIEGGRVTRVYGYDLSRLGRQTEELLAFFRMCDERGVTVKLAKDAIDTSNAMGRLLLTVLAGVATFDRDRKSESALERIASRKARGDKVGYPAFGYRFVHDRSGRVVEERDERIDLAPILRAVDDADGQVAPACRLLNERGILSPRDRMRELAGKPTKGERWHTSALKRIVDRERPGLLTTTRRKRRKEAPRMVLSGLLTCHCGQRMTPNPSRGQHYCLRSRIDANHEGRATVSERLILPWVYEEAARLTTPPSVVEEARDISGERAALEREREAIRTQHRAGLITDDEMVADTADVKRRLQDLDARATFARHEMPEAFDPDWDVESQNEVLAAMWETVVLDKTLRPMRAVWRREDWRAAA